MSRIIISRTDAIGDVVLTLPLAGYLKEKLPGCTLIFFGRSYTKPVIELSNNVDEFINYDDFSKFTGSEQEIFLKAVNADCIIHVFPRSTIAKAAKSAGIKKRIGSSHRLYHWTTCNKLIHFSRKNSGLHEAQLNFKLLSGLNLPTTISLNSIRQYYSFKTPEDLPQNIRLLIAKEKLNVVVHPRSHGSAREWGLENYKTLVDILLKKNITVFITGSPSEKETLQEWIKTLPSMVNDLTGQLSLPELISLLNNCDGIVAGSTGPLHIASALNRHALGLFPPIKPMHPGRWAPLGNHASFLCATKQCNSCASHPSLCKCLQEITPQQVADVILQWKKL